jgi:tetratricopeptide (TPR) repeat protein
MAMALENLAWLALRRGEPHKAVALTEESLTVVQSIDDEAIRSSFLDSLACALVDTGDTRRGVELFEHALTLKRKLGIRHGIIVTLANLAEALGRDEKLKDARAALEEALSLISDGTPSYTEVLVKVSLGQVLVREDELSEAEPLLRSGLQLASAIGHRVAAAEGLRGLSWVAAAVGSAAESARLRGAAERLAVEIGYVFPPTGASLDQRSADTAVRVLSEEGWNASVREGREMDLEAATSLALEAPT